MLRKLTLLFTLFICVNQLIAQIPAGYYDTANGLTGDVLKSALHNIIDDHTTYPYTSSSTDVWDILKESDKDPNNPSNVILFYTGWSVNAAQEYNSGSGWSREHVWAKSRGNFGTSQGAGTDAHHLRPADVTVNSARNNRWFEEADFEYIDGDGATGCFTSSTQWIWEPRPEVKGDVARMLFYMVVRYEGDAGEIDLELVDFIPADNNTNDPIHAKLSTLLTWHNDDPVDAFEQNRNDVVYGYQGNRNPFIDNPSWACDIWGGTCSGGSGGGGGGTDPSLVENFNNFSEGGSYQSGTFVGQDGSTWDYSSCRGDISITGSSATLGKGRTPNAEVNSGIITGGISTLKFDYMQAFSTPVNMDVYVNDVYVTTVNGGTQNVVTSSGDIPVNVTGDFTLSFIQASSTAGQITIDNIEWTAAGSGGGGGGTTTTEVLASYFESGWDNWTDGGGDCARYSGSRSAEGSYSIRLRDNSGTASSMTSPTMDLASYSGVTMDFAFYPYSMENGEDFFIRYSDDNGSSWTTIETFARGTDFSNNNFYDVSLDLNDYGINFTSQSKIRIQCDASANADHIYIDEVVITGTTGTSGRASAGAVLVENNRRMLPEFDVNTAEVIEESAISTSLSYPNPTFGELNITAIGTGANELVLFDLQGSVVITQSFEYNTRLNLSNLNAGMYILKITDESGNQNIERIIKK